MTGGERPGADELRSIHLFSSLGDAELDAIIADSRVHSLAPGERLFDFGAPATQFFYLRSGLLKLYRLSPEGAEKVIWFVRPTETFAEALMFADGDVSYPVTSEALAPSEVLGFEIETMRAILRESIDTCFRLMGAMSRRLRQQVEEIDRLTLHNATSRLATFLLENAPREAAGDAEVVLAIPKHEVASRLGVQPETFSRILARLGKQGLVRVDRQNIAISDREGLRRLAVS